MQRLPLRRLNRRQRIGMPTAHACRASSHRWCPLYPRKADMCDAIRHVRFGPTADIAPRKAIPVLLKVRRCAI